ncbi:MAG: di-heme oxidoredictase family protein [Terriglobales bacterium]
MNRRNVFAIALSTAMLVMASGALIVVRSDSGQEAPTGFTTPTLQQNPGSQSVSNGIAEPANDSFALDQEVFEEEEGVDTGLGPVYNARSCVDCHQNPVSGGVGQIAELRVGNYDRHGQFINPNIYINDGQNVIANRSLVNDRAVCPEAQERVPGPEQVRALRMSLNVLGDGFVEAIDDATLQTIAKQQPGLSQGMIAGEVILVPVLEAPGQNRVGRFGWKDQHGSLLSFASDAYLNEQGITNRLNMTDTTTVCKTDTDPEDHPDDIGMADIDHFAQFMRGTQAPPVDAVLMATADAQAGQQLFSQIGCAICHVTSITTAPTGTVINGGAFTVPDALGNKIIHPYSDFLLHDIRTGDGIQQNGPADTVNKVRTPPLWGLRTHDRLMHDGASILPADAIYRHGGEARSVIRSYQYLSHSQQKQLLTFLSAL